MAAATVPLPAALFNADAFEAELRAGQAIAAGKAALAAIDGYLDDQFKAGVNTGKLLGLRAAAMDSLLGALWDTVDWGDQELALIAVGGYGRGELHPRSDIDILVLQGDDCRDCDRLLEGFLTLLWDIGLAIGHSVRTVAECEENARADLTILTNLMETRVLRGADTLLARVKTGIAPANMWPSVDFFRGKLEEQRKRHAKYAETEYNLEPNVKSSPGGLRDLQVIGWIAERHFIVESLDELRTEQFISQEETEIFMRGREFMWRVRYALHMITGREEDRLLFDHQRELAAMWGFEDGDRLAVEQFMQIYYRWAGALSQLNEVLIQYFDQAILHADEADDIEEINERFLIRNGYIEARHPQVFSEHPGALLEVFLLSARHEAVVGIGALTIRMIRDNRDLIDESFRDDPENRATFLEIFRSPYALTRQLRRMSRYGVLGKYLPAWGHIVGQMQHDLFHTYTVDAHTLQVIENMRRFLSEEFDERFPVTSRVARRLPKFELLYLAGLFHDIGKGRGGDHSELGAVDAEAFCTDHGLSKRDTNLIVWLVRNHLLMSQVAQRKDISDPEVVQQFAEHTGDQMRLDYLFTLTVADINGTNPTLWNAWRGSLLRQLYTETKRALRRGLENPVDKQVWIEETKNAAINLLEFRGFMPEELEDLWHQRGEDYFIRERAEDIAWHTEAIAGHYDRERVLVLVRNTVDSTVANGTQIFIHARAHSALFSIICAELEQLNLSVHDARIYNSKDGMSLDTFFVLDSNGESIAEDGVRLREIKDHLTQVLSTGPDQASSVHRRTPRQVKSFTIPTQTRMSVDELKNWSVLEVATRDRPGLLARIGGVFVDFDIELQAAKIQTLGERVEDVFFLTDHNQQPLSDPALIDAIQQAIRDELDEQAVA
ncbi:MAG: [protein-PII] uridylyltransferase [Pseudomonadota bacterium]